MLVLGHSSFQRGFSGCFFDIGSAISRCSTMIEQHNSRGWGSKARVVGRNTRRIQGCQHYRFFRRSTEFRKWSVFLQIFIWSCEIFGFFTDFAIFWFFSTLFTHNWESSKLYSTSIELLSCIIVLFSFSLLLYFWHIRDTI